MKTKCPCFKQVVTDKGSSRAYLIDQGEYVLELPGVAHLQDLAQGQDFVKR